VATVVVEPGREQAPPVNESPSRRNDVHQDLWEKLTLNDLPGGAPRS
jgi:hypothetical protein